MITFSEYKYQNSTFFKFKYQKIFWDTKCSCLHSTWIQCIQILQAFSAPNINIWIKHIVQIEKYWKGDKRKGIHCLNGRFFVLNTERLILHLHLGVNLQKKWRKKWVNSYELRNEKLSYHLYSIVPTTWLFR